MTDEISREEYTELILINDVLQVKIDNLSTELAKEKKAHIDTDRSYDTKLYEKCERIVKLKSTRTQLLAALKKEQEFLAESVQANDKLKKAIIINEKQIERLSNSTSLTHEIEELDKIVQYRDTRIVKLNKIIGCRNTHVIELERQIGKLKTDLHHADEDSKIAIAEAVNSIENTTSRVNLPDTRKSITHKFFINGHEGYMTVGLFNNGTPGELFIRMAKEGSTIGGLMDAIGILTSMCLQHGMTVEKLREKFEHGRFEPSGFTHCKEIGDASSITDYIFRWMDLKFIEGRV